LGYDAGDVITTGSQNVIIGSGSDPSANSAANQIVIGYNTTGKGDNTVTIGNGDITAWSASDDGEVDLGSSSVEFKDLYIDGVAYTDALGFGTVAMTLPTADGSANQVLKTDGSGALSWTTSSGASAINDLSDALIEGNSIYIGNDPSSTTSDAFYNQAVGITTMDAITTGDYNSAFGYSAFTSNTTGSYNTASGLSALYSNTSGDYNMASGMQALYSNTTGDYNMASGVQALKSNTTAYYSTAIGANALYNANRTSDTDGYNTALGYNAGNSGTNDITTGNKNTLLGASTAASDAAGTNQTVIGYGASGKDDNTVTIGNGDITLWSAADDGEVDLGSSSVEFKDLYIDGVAYTDALGFGTVAMTLPTADGSANQVLKTDGSGALAWTDVSATTVTISDNENTSETNALVFTSGGDVDGGSMGLESDGDATYNPSTGVIGATGFSGATVVASTSVDITGSTGLILENDETITNSTDGTVLINGIVSGGTGSAAGVYQSNGDYDVTLRTGNSTTGSITITDGANGDITVAPNGTGKADFNDSPLTGYGADLQTESGTSKTLAAADNGTIIVCSSNSSITITVPASLPTGFNCMIIQSGSGQVSLSASSTTLNNRNGTKTAGQHAIMTVVHLGSDAFVVSGDTSSS